MDARSNGRCPPVRPLSFPREEVLGSLQFKPPFVRGAEAKPGLRREREPLSSPRPLEARDTHKPPHCRRRRGRGEALAPATSHRSTRRGRSERSRSARLSAEAWFPWPAGSAQGRHRGGGEWARPGSLRSLGGGGGAGRGSSVGLRGFYLSGREGAGEAVEPGRQPPCPPRGAQRGET